MELAHELVPSCMPRVSHNETIALGAAHRGPITLGKTARYLTINDQRRALIDVNGLDSEIGRAHV